MRNIITLAFIFVAASLFAGGKTKYNTENLNRRVILDVPETFTQLSEEDIIVKYGMDKLPLGLFEDPTGEISITVTEQIDSLKSGRKGEQFSRDISIEKSFLLASYNAIYTDMKVLKDTLVDVNGVPSALIEYESTLDGVNAKDEPLTTQQYNYILYGYRRNRCYMITFVCPLHLKDAWYDKAKHIMSSVKF